jgi:hypothetical protein
MFKYRGDFSLNSIGIHSDLHLPLLVEVDVKTLGFSDVLNHFEHSPRLPILATSQVPTSQIMCNQIDHLTFIRT